MSHFNALAGGGGDPLQISPQTAKTRIDSLAYISAAVLVYLQPLYVIGNPPRKLSNSESLLILMLY